jgi:hypothetical protein
LDRDGQLRFVRLEERTPARTKSLAEARPEFESRLLATKKQEVFESWLKEQDRQSTIEVFLKPGANDSKLSAISGQLSAIEPEESDRGRGIRSSQRSAVS